MKKPVVILTLLFLFVYKVYSQHNMLGKTEKYIRSFYNLSNQYSLKMDTIGPKTVLLTYKTEQQYPYYTYEIDLFKNLCVSFGIVSKDNSTLKAYLDMLNYVGELVDVDSTYNNFVYKVETNQAISFFTIKQPYFNSQFITRRSLFYILVTEQPRLIFEKSENEKKEK